MHATRWDVPLGRPPLRQWDLTSNSTRYDRLIAAPSDQGLEIVWSTWVAVTSFIVLFVGAVLLAILANKKVRTNAFNVYLCFLMGSDFLFSAFCMVTCAMNVATGHYFAPAMCRFQSFYCTWTIGSSVWMNAVISWQIHKMLASSHIRQHYIVPTTRQVVNHSLMVYFYNMVIAGLGILPASASTYIPHQSAAVSGEACLPTEYDTNSTMFMFLAFIPLIVGIPLLYIVWVCLDIYRRQLMPPTGRRRWLSMYFARITLSLFIMWVPFFAMVFAAGGSPWVNFAGGTIAHLQGAITAGFGLMKPDTKNAFLALWCRWHWPRCLSSSGGTKGTALFSSSRFEPWWVSSSQRISNCSHKINGSDNIQIKSKSNNSNSHAECTDNVGVPFGEEAQAPDGFLPIQSENFTYEDEGGQGSDTCTAETVDVSMGLRQGGSTDDAVDKPPADIITEELPV